MVSPVSGSLPAIPAQNSIESATVAQTGFSANVPAVKQDQKSTSAPVKQSELDDVLKNTGFKGEIDTSNPNQTVVRIVDDTTGKTVVQIPSVAALSFAEALRRITSNPSPFEKGVMLDEAA